MTAALAALTAVLAATPQAHAAGDHDTWAIAKEAAAKYHVSATLLVCIRLHENPKRRNDYKACGVKNPHRYTRGKRDAYWRGKWYPGGLKGQLHKCADIVSRYAKRYNKGVLKRKHRRPGDLFDPEKPTQEQVAALGRFYAEGSNHWGKQVWSLYRRMTPTRAEVAR